MALPAHKQAAPLLPSLSLPPSRAPSRASGCRAAAPASAHGGGPIGAWAVVRCRLGSAQGNLTQPVRGFQRRATQRSPFSISKKAANHRAGVAARHHALLAACVDRDAVAGIPGARGAWRVKLDLARAEAADSPAVMALVSVRGCVLVSSCSLSLSPTTFCLHRAPTTTTTTACCRPDLPGVQLAQPPSSLAARAPPHVPGPHHPPKDDRRPRHVDEQGRRSSWEPLQKPRARCRPCLLLDTCVAARPRRLSASRRSRPRALLTGAACLRVGHPISAPGARFGVGVLPRAKQRERRFNGAQTPH